MIFNIGEAQLKRVSVLLKYYNINNNNNMCLDSVTAAAPDNEAQV